MQELALDTLCQGGMGRHISSSSCPPGPVSLWPTYPQPETRSESHHARIPCFFKTHFVFKLNFRNMCWSPLQKHLLIDVEVVHSSQMLTTFKEHFYFKDSSLVNIQFIRWESSHRELAHAVTGRTTRTFHLLERSARR